MFSEALLALLLLVATVGSVACTSDSSGPESQPPVGESRWDETKWDEATWNEESAEKLLRPAEASTVGTLTSFRAGSTILASEMNANFTAVKTAVDDNAAGITSLETSMSAAQSTISSHTATLSTHTSQIGTLQTDSTTAAGQISALQSSVSTAATQIGTLQTASSMAAGQITDLQASVITATAEIGTLSNLNTTAKGDLVSAINEVRASLPDLAGYATTSDLAAYATMTEVTTALDDYGNTGNDNFWSGVQSFLGLTIPTSGSEPVTCGVSATGRIYFNSNERRVLVCNGSEWKYVEENRRFIANGSVNPGATLTINFGGPTAHPQVALWQNNQLVTGNAALPITYSGTALTVTNNSGGTLSLTLIADVPGGN